MSRTSISRITRSGMLLIAPGWTRQTPVVATVSRPPRDLAAASTASTASAAAHRASRRPAIRTAPACPPSPFQVTRKRRRGRDGRDDADRQAGSFQERALFDMQLDEGGEISRRQPDRRQLAVKPGRPADLVERCAVGILASAAIDSADSAPESARLPRQPMPNRVGSSLVNIKSSIGRTGSKPARSQRANRRQPTEHPDRAVEPARVRYRVDMRACPYRCQVGPQPFPPRERVADRVFANRQAGALAQLLDVGPSRQVGLGIEHASHRRAQAHRSWPRALRARP